MVDLGIFVGAAFLGLAGWALSRPRRIFACFMYFDDSDIKIAGEHPSEQIRETMEEPVEEITAELTEQRENGNLDKARELGKRLAIDVCNFTYSQGELDGPQELQAKILYAFVSDYTLNSNLPSQLVSQTAYNEYMTTFKAIDVDFYDEVQSSVAYSMYVLCSRKEDDNMVTRLGEAFAKLCGNEDDPVWITKGMKLFEDWSDKLQQRIIRCNFAE